VEFIDADFFSNGGGDRLTIAGEHDGPLNAELFEAAAAPPARSRAFDPRGPSTPTGTSSMLTTTIDFPCSESFLNGVLLPLPGGERAGVRGEDVPRRLVTKSREPCRPNVEDARIAWAVSVGRRLRDE